MPDDVDARRHIIDIHYRMGNAVQGIQDLDELLQIYARQQRADLILDVLETLAGANPEDMGLHHRLGGVYAQMKSGRTCAGKNLNSFASYRPTPDYTKKLTRPSGASSASTHPMWKHYQQLLQQMGGG